MTNQEVNEYMQRFLDDDLNEEELEALMEHIRLTPASAILFERLQRLDSELEQLPKVAPPMSIVDSILPRLELAGLDEHPPVTETATVDGMPSRVVPVARRATLRYWVNYRVLGGVVAAGIVLTLFFTNFGPQTSFQNANEGSTSNMLFDTQKVAEGNANFAKDDASMKSLSNEAGQSKEEETMSEADHTSPEASADPTSPEVDMNSLMVVDQPGAPALRVDNGEQLSITEESDAGLSADAPRGEASSDIKATSENDSVTVAVKEPAIDSKMSITASLLLAVVSPNEQLICTVNAVAEGGHQIYIADQSGHQVYESAVYLGSLNQLTWSPDSTQLHFEAIMDNGTTVNMTIHVSAQLETIKKAE